MNNRFSTTGGSGGTEGIYKLSSSLAQKLPSSKEIQPSKTIKSYIDKNKKILHSVVQNDPSVDAAKRKLSNLSKTSKEHKKISKERTGNYSMVKDKYYNKNHYNTDNSKHKRSSSDSHKLYDLNKWSNFKMPATKQKSKTNEDIARIK